MKHFMCPVNQNYSLCGIRIPDEEMTSDIDEKYVCGNCSRTKHYMNLKKLSDETKAKESSMFRNWKKFTSNDCKYPQIKEACLAKKKFRVRVTPEQSEEVQKIAFECGVGWNHKIPYRIRHKDKLFLCFLEKGNGNFSMFWSNNQEFLEDHTYKEVKIDEKPTKSTDCKYPNLKKAIQERQNIKMRVTPEQSAEVQKIAFECDVYWLSGFEKDMKVKCTHHPFLYISLSKRHPYGICYGSFADYFSCSKEEEFSLEYDCFVSDIEKCKANTKQHMDGKVNQLIQTIEESLKELKVLLNEK